MHKYYVYTTIFIKGFRYQYLDIYVCSPKLTEDNIRAETLVKYHDKILKSDRYIITIVLKYK